MEYNKPWENTFKLEYRFRRWDRQGVGIERGRTGGKTREFCGIEPSD